MPTNSPSLRELVYIFIAGMLSTTLVLSIFVASGALTYEQDPGPRPIHTVTVHPKPRPTVPTTDPTPTKGPNPTKPPTASERSKATAKPNPINTEAAPKPRRPVPTRASRVASDESQPITNAPKEYARSVMTNAQFSCFSSVISRESGWDINATNPSSGAYGLGQALPGFKMASAGSDWRTNGVTQVKWVLGYMNSRYGSPCGAWEFWRSHSWY
ncbi:aggregation-promoting factor C-terminal-like domain-containing protein [Streptomyces tubercidicus]|uniref:aggregation-promoting factor C-terminal-like domain-containing protein n=1 Tax=Streptomyces tubercidicus TaxID=47759 RepID=UPI0036A92A1A